MHCLPHPPEAQQAQGPVIALMLAQLPLERCLAPICLDPLVWGLLTLTWLQLEHALLVNAERLDPADCHVSGQCGAEMLAQPQLMHAPDP